jgi:hypothetical protein
MSGLNERRSNAALTAFDHHIAQVSEGLLSTEEEGGLRAVLPRLAELAELMGVIDRPVKEWTGPEMMRFLTLAVRAAVPLRQIHHGDPDLSDRLPF